MLELIAEDLAGWRNDCTPRASLVFFITFTTEGAEDAEAIQVRRSLCEVHRVHYFRGRQYEQRRENSASGHCGSASGGLAMTP